MQNLKLCCDHSFVSGENYVKHIQVYLPLPHKFEHRNGINKRRWKFYNSFGTSIVMHV